MCKECEKRLNYAKRIVSEGMKSDFYELVSSETSLGVSTSYKVKRNRYISLNLVPGYYTIYREIDNKLECLYVGKTDQNIHQRINRWAKGIAGKLRHDESHSAATKARNDGVRLTDKLYIKYMDMARVKRIVDDKNILSEPLDEWIAPLLKSKYNERTFELNASLEDFFE
jgi:hypothetical protein